MGPRVPSAGRGAALLLPGVLLATTSFMSGGFFPGATAGVCIVVLAALVLRLVGGTALVAHARARMVVAVGALALFAGWVLVSTTWSDATARGLLEYQRALLYLATLVLFALLGRSTGAARLLLGGLALGGVVVCVAALGVWLAPDHLPVGAEFPRVRLSWPTSYWNTTGLLGGLTALFCLGLTCDPEAPAPVRALGAGGMAPAVAVLFFTVSRGAALALGVGLVAFVLLRPGRGLLTGGVVAALTSLVALLVANAADGLDVALPVPAQAVADGHRTAWLLAALALTAVLARAALLPLDRRLEGLALSAGRVRAVVLGAAVAAVVVALAAGGAGRVRDAYDDFSAPAPVASTLAPAQRFATIANNGRLEHWRVAIDLGFDRHPWHGSGAGTYALLWARGRDREFSVVDGHSLYVETLGELGIVGLALVVVTLLSILYALGRLAVRRGGPWTALAAAALGWSVHAGIDWLWEVPAVTLWLFAAGGLALGAPFAAERRATAAARDEAPRRFPALGVALALGCVLLAILPWQIGRSQRSITDAVQAFRSGDCATTAARALDANRAVASRPEPFELLAYCDVRIARPQLAERMIGAAIVRDPANWEFRYDQAIITAAAGGDPRPALRAAQARNPLHPYVKDLAARLEGVPRSRWRRVALAAPTVIPGR